MYFFNIEKFFYSICLFTGAYLIGYRFGWQVGLGVVLVAMFIKD